MSSFTTPLEYTPIDSYREGRPLYSIDKEFEYKIGSLKYPLGSIIVPKGYITDLASIPWPLSLIIKPNGPWAKAAVIHDYMYDILAKNPGTWSKVVADGIFYEGMIVLKVKKIIAIFLYTGVRLFNSWRY